MNTLSFKSPQEMKKIETLFSDEIRLLLTTLKMSKLGGLNVVECENPDLQTKLFDYFRYRLADHQIYLHLFEIDHNHLNLVRSLTGLMDQASFDTLNHKYTAIVIFVHGLETLTEDQQNKFFHLLNFLRDRLTLIEPSIVLWAKPATVNKLARSAPDFWSCKGSLFSFPADSLEAAVVRKTKPNSNSMVQQYVEAILQDPEYSIWKDLYVPLKVADLSKAIDRPPHRHNLADDELAQLQSIINRICTYPANQVIFKKGSTGTHCYILLAGEVEVSVQGTSGNDIVICNMNRGDFFGEIALVKNIPRTATIRTTKPSQFIELTRRNLQLVGSEFPDILELIKNTAQRRAQHRLQNTILPPLHRLSGRGKQNKLLTDALEQLQDEHKVIVLGDAGTGKTTLLRKIMLDLAESALDCIKDRLPVSLPVYVKLNTIVAEDAIEDVILEMWQGYGIVRFQNTSDLHNFLKGQIPADYPIKQFVFIMDGLDQLETSDVSVEGVLHRFISEFSDHRFIISCRTQEQKRIPDFNTLILQHLRHDDIKSFLIKYMGQTQGRLVAKETFRDPQLKELARIPLGLYMFTRLTKSQTEGFPKNRGMLFQIFTENMLERTDSEWWKTFGRSKSRTPLLLRRAILTKLGLFMQVIRTLTCPKDAWFQIIASELSAFRETASEEALEAIQYSTLEDIHEEIKFSGLIRFDHNRGVDQITFSHQSYQEFFAACGLQERTSLIEEYINSAENLLHWYNVIVFLYGISDDRVSIFSQILGTTNNYTRIWLAAQCLISAGEEVDATIPELKSRLGPQQQFALLFSLGLYSYIGGRYYEALTYLRQAGHLEPTNPEVQYELGLLYRQFDQFEQAAQHLEKTLKLRPTFIDAYNQLGLTYYDQEKYETALEVFSSTAELEPDNAHHYYNIAIVQMLLGRYEDAIQALVHALHLKPDYTDAITQLAQIEEALSSEAVNLLKDIPIAEKLTLEQLILMAKCFEAVDFEMGETVVKIGEVGDAFYIIESGIVEAIIPSRDGELIVTNWMMRGDFFGEIALLHAVQRTATIRCVTDARLLKLSLSYFKDIIANYPSLRYKLTETSNHRLLRDQNRVRRNSHLVEYHQSQLQISHEAPITVIVSDIHGSTDLTRTVGPEMMVAFLDEYRSQITAIVTRHGGTVNHSTGDKIIGVFSDVADGTQATHALTVAQEIQESYLNLQRIWQEKSSIFCEAGIGIGISNNRISITRQNGTINSVAFEVSERLSKITLDDTAESNIFVDQSTYTLLNQQAQLELEPVNYPTDPLLSNKVYRMIEAPPQ